MRQAIEGKRKEERKRERKKKERKREMLQMAVMERFNDTSLLFPRSATLTSKSAPLSSLHARCCF